ncbi:MAG: twin-arginine translocase TatA/TatE family subunit [Nitrospirota bacterium]|nr:MAG: twin-arginine translocase TatA/TatE family subunit [Nitrospirota bacterium]
MQELIVIFVVALIVFGPKRLPELGRTLGKALGELKRSMSGIKDQIDAEVKDVSGQGTKDMESYIEKGGLDPSTGEQRPEKGNGESGEDDEEGRND